MSSNSDKEIFDSTVEAYDNAVLFKDKKWAYITDNSNGGVFQSQIQLDLQQLSSQSNWISLKEAVVQFPIKQTITNAGSGSQTPSRCALQSATLKNGFHQMIDSVQLVIDGQTVQTSQIFKNVETQFKILKDWSKDTETKYGSLVGWGLDRTEAPTTETAVTLGNLSLSAVAPSTYGVKNDNTNAFMYNLGVKERLEQQNINASNDFQATVLGQSVGVLGKNVVDAAASATAQGQDCFCQFVLATIRLKDICPFVEQMPLTRNLRGYLYINYNAASTTITTDGSGSVTNIAHNQIYGRTQPGMFRVENNTDSQSFYPATAAANVWKFTSEISGIPSPNKTAAVPPITYARLNVPYYNANPTIDSILSQKKTFRYLEYQQSEFDLAAGASKTVTLSPGIAGVKDVLLAPYYTTINGVTVSPWNSSFDSAPATTSPMATIRDLQVMVGNVPIFNNPVTMDADMFLQEIASNGIEGGQVNELSSGLLSSKLWNEWYRYYYVNVGRRMDTDDGCSRSVIVQAANATTLPMKVLAFVHYNKEVSIDTNTGQVFMGRL